MGWATGRPRQGWRVARSSPSAQWGRLETALWAGRGAGGDGGGRYVARPVHTPLSHAVVYGGGACARTQNTPERGGKGTKKQARCRREEVSPPPVGDTARLPPDALQLRRQPTSRCVAAALHSPSAAITATRRGHGRDRPPPNAIATASPGGPWCHTRPVPHDAGGG